MGRKMKFPCNYLDLLQEQMTYLVSFICSTQFSLYIFSLLLEINLGSFASLMRDYLAWREILCIGSGLY